MVKYMKVYHDWLAVMEPLSDDERGRLITAALLYASTGEAVELTGAERYVFPVIRLQIDRDRASYTEISEKRAEAGRQGGRPPKQTEAKQANAFCEKQTEANESKKSQDKDQDQDHDQDQDQDQDQVSTVAPKGATARGARFTPPTVPDVAGYCAERGNRVDAQAFVDHYAAKGWKIGTTPMKDWRAAVRTWERQGGQTGQQARAAPGGAKPHFNPFLDELKEGLP